MHSKASAHLVDTQAYYGASLSACQNFPELLGSIRARKLSYFGHIIRLPQDSIENTIMLGHVEGYRHRGRPRINWIDNILSWSNLSGSYLLAAARNRRQWRALVHACSQPSRSDVGA